MEQHDKNKQKKIDEIKKQRESKPDLDAIELAKAPATKKGDAAEVAESILQRGEKIKGKWDRKKKDTVKQKQKEYAFKPKTNAFSSALRD